MPNGLTRNRAREDDSAGACQLRRTQLAIPRMPQASSDRRLGHCGGGSATPRFTARVSESDQRAVGTLSTRLPALPAGALVPTVRATEDKRYQRIAADLRGAITCGALRAGDMLPTFDRMASRCGVAFNTAQRAVRELVQAGLSPSAEVGALWSLG